MRKTIPMGTVRRTDSDQCTASSYRGTDKKRNPYGRGHYNRCQLLTTQAHTVHVDDWGHRFVLEPSFKVLTG
jgi:hypothetical protein